MNAITQDRRSSQPRFWPVRVAGAIGGIVFTTVIAATLALVSHSPAESQVSLEEEEVQSVELPDPPPPPPATPSSVTGPTLPPTPLLFDEVPSSSTVHIAPTPVPIDPLLAEVRPSHTLRFDYAPGQFRPDAGGWEPDPSHIFQRSEVDQQVVPIFQKVPEISAALYREVKNPRVRVLLVVNTDGSVMDIRLLKGTHPEFDRLVIEALAQWRFRPAMRKGRKVRCLTEVPVYVKLPGANPFSAN